MDFKIYSAREQDLINGCRQGNKMAQKRLYDTYSSKMHAVCYRYVRNQADAEDILIAAFTRIFSKISQFRDEGSFEGWIRRIVVNESLTFLRSKRAMYIETDLDHAEHQINYGHLEDHLAAEDLMNMISQLPDGYRVVFNMYAIDGYSHKEIATHLGISENTSKSQLSRARVYLQKMLAQYEEKAKKLINESAT